MYVCHESSKSRLTRFTTREELPNVCRVHSFAIARAGRLGFHARRAYPCVLAALSWLRVQSLSSPKFITPATPLRP